MLIHGRSFAKSRIILQAKSTGRSIPNIANFDRETHGLIYRACPDTLISIDVDRLIVNQHLIDYKKRTLSIFPFKLILLPLQITIKFIQSFGLVDRIQRKKNGTGANSSRADISKQIPRIKTRFKDCARRLMHK